MSNTKSPDSGEPSRIPVCPEPMELRGARVVVINKFELGTITGYQDCVWREGGEDHRHVSYFVHLDSEIACTCVAEQLYVIPKQDTAPIRRLLEHVKGGLK